MQADQARIVFTVLDRLSSARTTQGVVDTLGSAVRDLTSADGITVMLRDGGYVQCVGDDPVDPLWDGQRIPLDSCLGGWVILNRQSAFVEDVDTDSRVSRITLANRAVRSYAVFPIRSGEPLGALGVYWTERLQVDQHLVSTLQTLANACAMAIENARLFGWVEVAYRSARQEAQKYANLVNTVNGVVWEGDLSTFRFTFVSEQAARLLGYPLSDWTSDRSFWLNHVHADDRDWAGEFRLRPSEPGRSRHFEYRMIAVDGGIVLPTDAGQVTLVDLPIDGTPTAGTKESYTLRAGSTNALTVYSEADGSGNAQNVRVGIGSSITPAYTLDVTGDTNISSGSSYRINGTAVCTSAGCTASAASAIQNGTSTQTGNFNIQSASSGSVVAIIQGASGQSSDLLDIKTSTPATVFSVSSTGATLHKNSADSATAFQIQNSTATPLFTADTSGMQITIGGNVTVNGHIVSGNKSGTTTVAAGAAATCTLTSPTVNLTGNDTAGTVSITTATGSCSAGTLATVTFANAYASAPVVTLTPQNANGATLQYYYNSGTGTFTIATGNAPATATAYIFSYHVLQ